MEIETKEKPPILHFQVKNIGFCQQSESSFKQELLFVIKQLTAFSQQILTAYKHQYNCYYTDQII